MVSQTVSNLINAAAEELLVIDSGGTLTTQEIASCLDRLQRLFDESAVQRPLIFGERIDTLFLTPNKQSYTIGVDPTFTHSADFPVPWPTKIERANLFLTSTVRRPLEILTTKKWSSIRYQTVYGPPQALYFDRNFGPNGLLDGFGTLYFYLIPDQGYQWEFYSWAQQASITTSSDIINYPPGYASYWLYSLVVRIASMFGREPTALHLALLQQAKEAIMTENCPSPELVASDASRIGDGYDGGLYNWLIGETEYR